MFRKRPSPAIVVPLVTLLAVAVAEAEGQAPVVDHAGVDGEVVYRSESVGAYQLVTVVDGLQDPWSIAWLPDGSMLVTERPGRLRIVRDGTLLPEPVAGVPEVRYMGQGGLLDVALHPEFDSNRLVYLSFSKSSADGTLGTTAVVRGILEGNELRNVEEIFQADAWGDRNGHFGSRLAFDEDGYLFITIGDRQFPTSGDFSDHPAQDLMNHVGTIVRLHDDGSVPSDNPFVGRDDALPEIWSYGHRSPQGLAFDPRNGALWQTEHGPQGGDELNLILPGRNYGWPVIGYGVNYGGAPLHEDTHREGMEQPAQFWTPSIATSGLVIYTGDIFPEWQGSAFVGGLAGQQISRVPLVEDGEELRVGRLERPALMMGFGRVRDIRQGPDGYIYVAIDDRSGGGTTPIIRIEPEG